MTAIAPDAAEVAFESLAKRLAAGIEVDAEKVLVVLAAAGRSTSELQAACDDFAAYAERTPLTAP